MGKKQSVLLGLREKQEKTYSAMLDDYLQKVTKKQGIFQGFNKTFEPIEGFADQPEKRAFQKVQSTVKEQIDWFKEHTEDYFSTVLDIEKTNSGGIKGKLVVDGDEWGEFSVLELLRLKSIMDGKLRVILNELPLRDEKIVWKPTTNDLYGNRAVWEAEKISGLTKTTLKRTEIVNDPHIKDAPNRPPIVAQIDTQANTGSYTEQKFSGEITALERALLLVKYDKVYTGIIEALEEANNAEAQESELGTRFLNFMFS